MIKPRSLPATPPLRSKSSIRRGWARLAAWIADDNRSVLLACGFTIAHVVIWTAILTQLKAAQDVHFDVAEAFGWGQQFLFGYGKHPPLSGWVAGVWFRIFPVADWAAYALAMATTGFGMITCWFIALRVVDRRRAFLVLVMLALYPIFNFKGFKYNADLVQLATMPLLVLAYLDAFEKRTVRSGILLGLAAALALMCKYWVVTMVGAIGIAALLHPARFAFLRSPAPWVALVTLALAMVPHIMWLESVDFLPFTYAGDTYALSSRSAALHLVLGYIGHNFALLALPVALAAAALAWTPHGIRMMLRSPARFAGLSWSRQPNPAVNLPQALNIWIIQIIVAVGPPLGAFALDIYLKTDWGISLFFLTPLALVAIPALRVRQMAVIRLLVIWLVLSLAVLFTAPQIAKWTMDSQDAASSAAQGSRSQLARELTQLWVQRFPGKFPVVIAPTDVGEPVTFYSPDHPVALTPLEHWSSGLTTLEKARRSGFIGVCEANDSKQERCDAWMKDNAAGAEKLLISTRRFVDGRMGAATGWHVYIMPPAP